MGAVADWLAKEYGGRYDSVEEVVATAAAPSTPINGDPDAFTDILINLGAQDVFVSLNADVSASKGIKLAAGGGALIRTARDDALFVTRTLYAVSPGGASTLYHGRTHRTDSGS